MSPPLFFQNKVNLSVEKSNKNKKGQCKQREIHEIHLSLMGVSQGDQQREKTFHFVRNPIPSTLIRLKSLRGETWGKNATKIFTEKTTL